MTNISKSSSRKNMHLHTVDAFEIIDAYLPHPYVGKVQKLVGFSSSTIRNVRSSREGNIRIIKALLKVALQNKRTIEKNNEQLESLIKQ